MKKSEHGIPYPRRIPWVNLYHPSYHSLPERSLSFDERLQLLKELRKSVTQVFISVCHLTYTQYCLSSNALLLYQSHISNYLSQHPKGNKLRDVPQEYVSEGHCFSLGEYERELIYSFDVCSGCEAHAVMRQLQEVYVDSQVKGRHGVDLMKWVIDQIGKVTPYSEWRGQGKDDVDFHYCPRSKKWK